MVEGILSGLNEDFLKFHTRDEIKNLLSNCVCQTKRFAITMNFVRADGQQGVEAWKGVPSIISVFSGGGFPYLKIPELKHNYYYYFFLRKNSIS